MATQVTTKRPPPPTRCYVKVTDPKTNKSVTHTVYGIDAKRFIDRLPQLAETLAAAS